MKKVCGNTDFHRLFIYILIPFFMEPFSLPRGCPHPRSRCVPGGIDNLPQPKRNTGRCAVLSSLRSSSAASYRTSTALRPASRIGRASKRRDDSDGGARKFYSSMLLRSNTLSVLERYSRRLNGNVDSIGYGVTLIDKAPLRRISHDNSSRPNFHPRSS